VSPDCPPDAAPRPRRPLGVTGLIISARRVAFFAADFFFAARFFFTAGFPFAEGFFTAANFFLFLAVLAIFFFRVGFFLLTVFFLRADFFLAMGRVYQNASRQID